ISALIVRDLNDIPSNFRSTNSLSEILAYSGIPGLGGVDTRRLVHRIREYGACLGIITSIETPHLQALAKIKEYEEPHDAVRKVSRKVAMLYKSEHPKFQVVAVDCGIKMNIIRCLNELGCDVTVVPFDTKVEEVMKYEPDGLFISNGPGDPVDVKETISLIKGLLGKLPMFGICLGHQMIGLACGAETYKLKFGHRGGNHPVMNLKTDKIDITSQNHSYAINEESLKHTKLKVTHINMLDKTVEGMECVEDKVFSVQYHPESAPGPMDSYHLFDQFIAMMEDEQHA
ncbi:MAG: glutamine-hydrolyzing carbamoyl-phosphate synthase small subunit, partial [Erysipelotrichaceae bacterium]|nr:glutamine-hydrolyzing carbamoyl-phosphate synthase small subunit [Erysipelotrichaceae bacterium]